MVDRPLAPIRLLWLLAAATACRAAPTPTRAGHLDLPPAQAHAPRSCAFDVQSYSLDLELVPEGRALHATCRILLWPREGELREVELDLEDLQVSSVRDERGRSLGFERVPGKLRVALAEPLQPGNCAEIAVEYGGVPRRGLYFGAARDGVPTQAFTQGECEDSRGWFPCFDAPSDRATSELRVTMPAGWTAVAAGERIDRIERDGKSIERWRMTTPHPAYLTTLVAGELAVETGSFEATPLLFVAEPGLAARLGPNLGATESVLSVFSAITGRRYPYPKYAQACVADFSYGGMENISATTLTDTCLLDEKARRDAPQTGLVAHEAAHQWFGDLLTCRDWSHIWLNESFATYLGALYTEHDRGPDEFRAQLRDMQDAYVAADVGPNRRPMVHDVYRRPMDLFFSGHAYGGGAVRLHLLRSVLGDDAFFRGLRTYVALHAGRSVVTEDFRRAMEEASGTDLAGFFKDWLESPGFPEFEATWRYDDRRKLVILSVSQVQDVAGGTPAAFRIPVDVGIRGADGFRLVRVAIEKRRQLFEIPAPAKPLFVRFDANSAVPKRLEERKPVEEWTAIASLDEDVNGRRDAVRVLTRILATPAGQDPEGRPVAVLLERLALDPATSVRAEAAAALSRVRQLAVRDALTQAASQDPEARVRAAALEALCGMGPDPELARIALREYGTAFSWNTAAAAAALYGSAQSEGFVAWLRGEIASASNPEPLRSRLLPLLGRARDRGALETVVRIALDPDVGEELRAAAAREIGTLGRGDAVARRALESLLESATFRVRREAISALAALRDPGVLDALQKAHSRTVLVPELRAIEAAVEAFQGEE